MGISIDEFKKILKGDEEDTSNTKQVERLTKQIEKLKWENERLKAEIKPLRKLLQLARYIDINHTFSHDAKDLSKYLKKLEIFMKTYTKFGEDGNETQIKI